MSIPLQTDHGRSLADTARRICESRGGKWSGTKGMACCPAHDDRTPSLGVILGRKAILFHCFAGCNQQSVLAALAREGIDGPALFAGGSEPVAPPACSVRRSSAAALKIWREAAPLPGSPAKTYLEGRGILAASPALRFHPRTPLGPKGQTRFMPALIAAVSLDEGPIAIHRTFLAQDLSGKAAFAKPKRALGTLGAAAVRLFAAINGQLGLAEGIESAMAAYALTGVPTWATLGNERFGLVAIPESITKLHLFVDHDEGGNLAGQRGVAAYSAEGRIVRARRPSTVGSDWNDELQDWLRRKAARREERGLLDVRLTGS